MPLNLRTVATALLLLAAGAPLALAAVQTKDPTITPAARTVSGIQNRVIPLSGGGAEDTERGVARFSFSFDQAVDIQLKINGTVVPSAFFASGTTEDVQSPIEFAISDGTPVDLKDQTNTLELSVRDSVSTAAFPAPTSDGSFVIFVDNQKPNPPQNFTADGADEVLVVKWDAPTKTAAVEVVDGYIITYSTTDFSGMTTEQVAALPSRRVSAVGDQQATLEDLSNGQTYFITIRSADWVNNISDFPRATTGGGIKVVQGIPVRTVTLAELAGEDGGCFIATAAYGSYQEPHVMVLRQFRDRVLLKSAAGAQFVDWYYRTSPRFAAWIAAHDTARALARIALLPLYVFAFLVLNPAWLLTAGILLLTLATAGAMLRRQVQ